MPIAIDRADAPRLLRITFTGEFPSLAEQRRLRRELKESGELTSETAALYDLRRSTSLPQMDESQRILDSSVIDGPWPIKRAYLVNEGAQFGVLRQFLPLADSMKLGVEARIFTDPATAVAWLQLPG